jgi:competence protein ComEA
MRMDRFGEWRPIEPAAAEGETKPPLEPVAKPRATDLRLVGVLAAGVLLIVGAYIWLTRPNATPDVSVSGQAAYFDPQLGTSSARATQSGFEVPSLGRVVVDVEGAVVSPGLHILAAGSRVGDAIAAAGGYAPSVDIAAAATGLNLAQSLADGAKVHVPARGESAGPSAAVGTGPDPPAVRESETGGLINVNTATAEQLDTLPGIGPVTAAKIIGAREEAVFAAVDDLLSREVVGASTFEKIRALVSVSP